MHNHMIVVPFSSTNLRRVAGSRLPQERRRHLRPCLRAKVIARVGAGLERHWQGIDDAGKTGVSM
jgi:hypothetical protein